MAVRPPAAGAAGKPPAPPPRGAGPSGPKSGATTAGATTMGATTMGATTVGATTAGVTGGSPAEKKLAKDFAETLTSEFQAVGDQSHGMHDDPRQAYQSRKSYVLLIEIIMAVCVIALIVGTVVMFVVSSNSGSITLKSEQTTVQSSDGVSTVHATASSANSSSTPALVVEEGDYASASPS